MSKTMGSKELTCSRARAAALLAVMAGLCSHPGLLAAQDTGHGSPSQRKALAVLNRAIDVAGGWEAITRAGSYTERASVSQIRHGQEARPGGDVGPGRTMVYTISADPERGAFVAQAFPNDTATTPAGRIVNASGKWFVVRVPQNTFVEMDDPQPFQGLYHVASFVPTVLRDARRHAESLRYVNRTTAAQDSGETVTFVDDDGRQVRLAFSPRTGHLLRIERTVAHPLFGDLTLRVTFDDFRAAADLVVPHRITADLPGVYRVEATCLAVTPGAPLDASLLQRPEGARPDPMMSSDKRSIEPFPGIHHFLNIVQGYNALYVEQEEGLVVIETPGGPSTSEEILADAAAHVPEKPVRGLVLTHHHFDHAAGLWTYIERGIPVITTPGNRAFVEGIAAAARTAHGAPSPQAAQIVLVDGRKMIGTGPNRFELINVGPNPHADEILIAYFPERRMMYVPDIYGYLPGFTPPPLLLSFAERLDSLGLDVETVLTAHTDPDTMEGLRSAVQRARGGG